MYKTSQAAIAAILFSFFASTAYSAPAPAPAATTTAAPATAPSSNDAYSGNENGPDAPFKVIQRLHSQLQLNADQEKQWQTALTTMQQNRKQIQQNYQKLHEQLKAQQNVPILDLNALHTARQQAEQQSMNLREQTSAAWLKLYNGLNDQQKTLVSTALKQRFAQMGKHHKHMKKHSQ